VGQFHAGEWVSFGAALPSRGGIEVTASLLRRLRASGVGVRSLREPWLDTSDPHIAEDLPIRPP